MRYVWTLILAGLCLSACAGDKRATAAATAQMPVPTLSLDSPTPTFDGTPFPAITQFQVSNYMPDRGDTVTVSWDVKDAREVRIETYDLDYFPSHYSLPLDKVIEHLPAAGSIDLTIPANYQGTGWQIHLRAVNDDTHLVTDRRDLVFADVKQIVLLDIDNVFLTALAAKRGEHVTITWDTHVTTRVSRDGFMQFDQPLSGYEGKLYLDFFAVYDQGNTPEAPYQHFGDLPLSGSLAFTIGDYAPEYARVMINIGLNVDGQNNIYDVRSVELLPS